MLLLSRCYPIVRYSNQCKSSSLLYLSREGQFSTSVGGRGDGGCSTTHFSSQKVYFGRDRHDGGFQPSQNHCKEITMA